MSIYKKLLSIQKEVKGLSKDKKSHNYDYVTGNKLLSFIKPIMDREGVILKQEILSIENTRQDYKTKYAEKSEILSKVMMRFTWIDCETGEKDENLFGANGQNDWEKGLGSALTYGERYFLLKFFHIATDEDDIDNPSRKKEKAQPITVPIQKETATEIDGRKIALKDSQLKAVLESKNKAHANHFLDNFRMSDDERTQLKAIL
jgi:hypothetical protein